MKGDPSVIAQLNLVLTNQLTHINQTFLHARMFKNWGLAGLDAEEYGASIGEMKRADKVIHRILFLEGMPNLQKLGRLRIGEDVQEMLQADLDCELAYVETLREAITHCEEKRDYISRELLDSVLEAQEERVDWLETQLSLIQSIGIANYQQSMMGEEELH